MNKEENATILGKLLLDGINDVLSGDQFDRGEQNNITVENMSDKLSVLFSKLSILKLYSKYNDISVADIKNEIVKHLNMSNSDIPDPYMFRMDILDRYITDILKAAIPNTTMLMDEIYYDDDNPLWNNGFNSVNNLLEYELTFPPVITDVWYFGYPVFMLEWFRRDPDEFMGFMFRDPQHKVLLPTIDNQDGDAPGDMYVRNDTQFNLLNANVLLSMFRIAIAIEEIAPELYNKYLEYYDRYREFRKFAFPISKGNLEWKTTGVVVNGQTLNGGERKCMLYIPNGLSTRNSSNERAVPLPGDNDFTVGGEIVCNFIDFVKQMAIDIIGMTRIPLETLLKNKVIEMYKDVSDTDAGKILLFKERKFNMAEMRDMVELMFRSMMGINNASAEFVMHLNNQEFKIPMRLDLEKSFEEVRDQMQAIGNLATHGTEAAQTLVHYENNNGQESASRETTHTVNGNTQTQQESVRVITIDGVQVHQKRVMLNGTLRWVSCSEEEFNRILNGITNGNANRRAIGNDNQVIRRTVRFDEDMLDSVENILSGNNNVGFGDTEEDTYGDDDWDDDDNNDDWDDDREEEDDDDWDNDEAEEDEAPATQGTNAQGGHFQLVDGRYVYVR